jgi:hypothetical protein
MVASGTFCAWWRGYYSESPIPIRQLTEGGNQIYQMFALTEGGNKIYQVFAE